MVERYVLKYHDAVCVDRAGRPKWEHLEKKEKRKKVQTCADPIQMAA